LYREEINDELQRYFDHYAKGIQNGWESDTPPVRLSLLGFEGSPAKTILERPETEYPPARQVLRDFYLDAATRTLTPERLVEAVSASYDSHHLTDSLDFTLIFSQYTELAGYPLATIWFSCPDHEDLDVAVQIRKIDAQGKLLSQLNYPIPVPEAEGPDVNVLKTLGPQGFLRASHAVSLDRAASPSKTDLFYTHRSREPILPLGRKVKLEIPIWPIGMVFAPGEGIMLRVSGHDMAFPETDMCRLTEPEDENVGRHFVHTGGEEKSFLTLPILVGG